MHILFIKFYWNLFMRSDEMEAIKPSANELRDTTQNIQ